MVQEGLADGMVSGSVHSTAATIRPAFEIIKTKPDTKIVSSVFFMCLADKVLVYGDCAVNPTRTPSSSATSPSSRPSRPNSLASSPGIATLSYSTGTSGLGADVEKAPRQGPPTWTAAAATHLKIEGPIQYDAALN